MKIPIAVGMESMSTVQTTRVMSHTPSEQVALQHIPSKSHRSSSRQSGTLVSSMSLSGQKMEVSHSYLVKEIRKLSHPRPIQPLSDKFRTELASATTPTTSSAGKGTPYRKRWMLDVMYMMLVLIRSSSLLRIVLSLRRRMWLLRISVVRSRLLLRILMLVSTSSALIKRLGIGTDLDTGLPSLPGGMPITWN